MKSLFNSEVNAAFLAAGFNEVEKVLRLDGIDVSLIVEIQKISGRSQSFINVGFWLHSFGSVIPAKVELTHLYYRLERLFPEHRDLILTAGDAHEGSSNTISDFSACLTTDIIPQLRKLVSAKALQVAFAAGRLAGGLVRKEARSVLE